MAAVHSLLQAFYPAYERDHPVARHGRRAMRDILRCGTGELGTWVRRCPAGHFTEVAGCSCRHRSCPACSGARRLRWLDAWMARLLPGLHLHTVLTLPSEFHPLWRHNRRAMAQLFFATAQRALFTLLGDPQHLGAVPGILMVLHTWSRSLSLHPHLHLVVTGGGLGPDGHWKPLARDFLVPVGALRKRFRRLLLDALEAGWKAGRIGLPPQWSDRDMRRQLRRTGRLTWNVRIEPPYDHGNGVVNYLARYVMGGPIGNRRIVNVDGQSVEFVVGREAKDPATIRLAATEFVRRWIEHIPDSGLHTVRGYGLYAAGAAAKREACRAEIAATQTPTPWPSRRATPGSDRVERCPVCNCVLVVEDTRRGSPRRRARAVARAPAWGSTGRAA